MAPLDNNTGCVSSFERSLFEADYCFEADCVTFRLERWLGRGTFTLPHHGPRFTSLLFCPLHRRPLTTICDHSGDEMS